MSSAQAQEDASAKPLPLELVEELAHFANGEIRDDLLRRRRKVFETHAILVGQFELLCGFDGRVVPVEERGQSENGIGREKIRSIDRNEAFEARDVQRSGNDLDKNAARGHHTQDRHRIVRFEQAQELLRDALARQFGEIGFHICRGFECDGIDLALAIPGVEAEEAQDAQIILADTGSRIADEANALGRKILDAAGIIIKLALAIHRERIDREVAAFRIERSRRQNAPRHGVRRSRYLRAAS